MYVIPKKKKLLLKMPASWVEIMTFYLFFFKDQVFTKQILVFHNAYCVVQQQTFSMQKLQTYFYYSDKKRRLQIGKKKTKTKIIKAFAK